MYVIKYFARNRTQLFSSPQKNIRNFLNSTQRKSIKFSSYLAQSTNIPNASTPSQIKTNNYITVTNPLTIKSPTYTRLSSTVLHINRLTHNQVLAQTHKRTRQSGNFPKRFMVHLIDTFLATFQWPTFKRKLCNRFDRLSCFLRLLVVVSLFSM